MKQVEVTVYRVWDRSVRGFHWINVVAVLALLGTGLVILNGKSLGLAGEAKILMKALHVWAGYLFALNLGWRIVQGFRGSHFTRWGAILPFGRDYLAELGAYLRSLRSGEPRYYLGHNPLGRLMIVLLMVLMIVQALTGLLLAGTDLYYPPLGGWIAQWLAPVGVDPASLQPGDRSLADPAAWESMRALRSPFIFLHVQLFYLLLGAVVLHLAGVVFAELRERVGLVSAMINGEKRMAQKPVDLPPQ
jgi:Ni/Fe-hydrogenase 1 B-type cytochrome subunit